MRMEIFLENNLQDVAAITQSPVNIQLFIGVGIIFIYLCVHIMSLLSFALLVE